VGALLQRLSKLPQPVDLVYVDPPYEAEDEYSGTLNFFGSVRGRTVLAADALVIAEHSSKATLPAHFGALEHTRLLKQGDAALSFFAFAAAERNLHPDAGR
jgi:16S rRNA G966 N2-methylase RsmD